MTSIKLGRGMDSLIPQHFDTTLLTGDSERIQKINVDNVEPNPEQPRRHFDQTTLEELAASIKQYGILQPLVVTSGRDGKYQIVAGERRWRAAKLAKLSTVPVIVRTTVELEQLEIALIENVQRVDLSPLEQAVSIERLHQQFSQTYDDIGKRLGKAPSTIHNIVRLLQLPDSAKKALHDKVITEGHARAVLSLKDYEKEQEALLNQIRTHGWSVRQAERFVTAFKDGFRDTKAARTRIRNETPETKKLSKTLGTPVSIRRMAKGGKLEISFTSDEELQRVVSRLLT